MSDKSTGPAALARVVAALADAIRNADKWVALCDALGYSERPEGQGGVRTADAETVIYACKQALRGAECYHDATRLRTLGEYHDDDGAVLWWVLPIAEPPYVGTPGDSGWPGYHTHWTPILEPVGEYGGSL